MDGKQIAYDQVIRDQLVNNIIEKVSGIQRENPKEFFLPHKPVIGQNAESTKLRVVYDASAKSESSYSLNDCLETDHPFKINCGTS